jgi:hypothetical protein
VLCLFSHCVHHTFDALDVVHSLAIGLVFFASKSAPSVKSSLYLSSSAALDLFRPSLSIPATLVLEQGTCILL